MILMILVIRIILRTLSFLPVASICAWVEVEITVTTTKSVPVLNARSVAGVDETAKLLARSLRRTAMQLSVLT